MDFNSLLNVSEVPQNDRTAAFVAESRENRRRCYEMSEQMTMAVAADGEKFQQYLDAQSHFDRYTPNNVLLIMAQKPDAQKIGDYGYWRSRGLYVKRYEYRSPILIMEPGKEYKRDDDSIGTYYNAKKVYDISQTNIGDRLPSQEEQLQEESAQENPEQKSLWGRQLIRALVNCPPAAIVAVEPEKMPEGKGALFDPDENCIYVRKEMNVREIFKSVTPELVLAGFADGEKEYNPEDDLFHAYSATYILCKKYGVDTKEFDFSHVPEMFEGMDQQGIRGELSKIREAANRISSRREKVLETSRNQNQKAQTQYAQQKEVR